MTRPRPVLRACARVLALVIALGAHTVTASVPAPQGSPSPPCRDSAESALRQAKTLSESGRFADYVAAMDRVIASYPTEARAYIERSTAYRGLGELDRALADAEKAVELAPKLAWARCNRATSLRRLH